MLFVKAFCQAAVLVTLWQRASALLVTNASTNVAVYWGQNSGNTGQKRLAYYCENSNIDVFQLAFVVRIVGTGGVPEFNFANQGNDCTTFPGTALLNCPQIGADIKKCQSLGKTILLSIGGATYTEGGFSSPSAAVQGAHSIWDTFGPPGGSRASSGASSGAGSSAGSSLGASPTPTSSSSSSSSISPEPLSSPGPCSCSCSCSCPNSNSGANINANTSVNLDTSLNPIVRTNNFRSFGTRSNGVNSSASILRPFGDAAVDGFDFDFEATVSNMVPFANTLRSLMDTHPSGRKFYLTAAPQCPFPDAADKAMLSGAVAFDAVWVQFYNNYCGLTSFVGGSKSQNQFNFNVWDGWAKNQSKNSNVKVFIGLPAGPTAAGSGYVSPAQLKPIVDWSRTFSSFGGVMMWDASQAVANTGFLSSVKKVLNG